MGCGGRGAFEPGAADGAWAWEVAFFMLDVLLLLPKAEDVSMPKTG